MKRSGCLLALFAAAFLSLSGAPADLAPLLTHLVRSPKLTPHDREALRKMLDEMDGEGKKRKG